MHIASPVPHVADVCPFTHPRGAAVPNPMQPIPVGRLFLPLELKYLNKPKRLPSFMTLGFKIVITILLVWKSQWQPQWANFERTVELSM
jgi:hypothetical protein